MKTGFGERLEKIAKMIGGISLLARLAGVSRRSLVLYISGKVDPSRTRLIHLAKAAGVNFEWLAIGKGPMRGGNYLDDNFVLIPTVLEDGSSVDHLAASKDFLQTTLAPLSDNLILIRCSDHSMEPTIACGNFVLVDKTDKNIYSHEIICLRSAGKYLFRRLIRSGVEDEVILVSDRFPQQRILTWSEFEKVDYVGKAVQALKKLR